MPEYHVRTIQRAALPRSRRLRELGVVSTTGNSPVGNGEIRAHDHAGQLIRPEVLVLPSQVPSDLSALREGEFAMYISNEPVAGEVPSGSLGIDESELWSILTDGAGGERIAKSHLPLDTVFADDLDGYIKSVSLSTISDLNAGWLALLKEEPDICTEEDLNGLLTGYVTLATSQTISGAKAFTSLLTASGGISGSNADLSGYLSAAKLYVPSYNGNKVYDLYVSDEPIAGEAPSGGGGLDEAELWSILTDGGSGERIVRAHLPLDAVYEEDLSGFLTSVSLSTISDLNAGWDALLKAAPDFYTKGEVGELLEGYVTLATAQTVSGKKTFTALLTATGGLSGSNADFSSYVSAAKLYVPSYNGNKVFDLYIGNEPIAGEAPSGSSGIDEAELWSILTDNAGGERIAKAHLPLDTVYDADLTSALGRYALKSDLDSYYTKTDADGRYVLLSSYTAADVLAKLKTVDGSGSGIDADLLDGVQLADIFRVNILPYEDLDADNLTDNYTLYTTYRDIEGKDIEYVNFPKSKPAGSFFLLTLKEGAYRKQIYGDYNNNHLYVRSSYYSGSSTVFNDWSKVALTTDNVASATKLQTARTLWGQPFDGTGNVSGNMSGVTHIYNSATRGVYLRHGNSFPTNAGDLLGVVGVGMDINSYGLYMWSRGDGRGHVQVGRADGTNTAYDLILQEFGGNVGIGTTSPAYKLDVAGTLRATDIVASGRLFIPSYNGNDVYDLYVSTSPVSGTKPDLAAEVETLKILSTATEAHLSFAATSYAYITSQGAFAFIPDGQSASYTRADLIVDDGYVRPGSTGVTFLGMSSARWATIYAVSANLSGMLSVAGDTCAASSATRPHPHDS